jgi:DAACS family dicarboxylate/amino acid:cation (Na+ or H+) symporter/aerobic C4-dicarboxylate transport protein
MRLLSKLHVQLFIAITAGILFGAIFPARASHLDNVGSAFIWLIRPLLAPIVFGTVTLGIGKMSDLKSVGRLGIKAMVYFQVMSGLALLMGLAVADVVRPGAGMKVGTLAMPRPAAKATPGLLSYLQRYILHPNILAVLLISICTGIALARLKEKERLTAALEAFLHVMFLLVRWVMYVAPVAAFGAIAVVIGKYGLANLLPYAKLVACVYATCLAFLVVALAPVARLCGVSLWRFLGYILDEILIVFGTCSTEPVLPRMIAKLEALGCPGSLVGLVLPAGYSFNADGTSIYLTLAALFIAQATHTPLTLGDQLTVLGVLILTSKGSAGVAGGGLVILTATLAATNKIPAAGLTLVLGIESLLNQPRAVTNLIGNGVATLAMARWEGTLDLNQARRQLEHPIKEADEGNPQL